MTTIIEWLDSLSWEQYHKWCAAVYGPSHLNPEEAQRMIRNGEL